MKSIQMKINFTSYHVGMAAAFGGAAFAFRALGIGIPSYPPGGFIDLGLMIIPLSGMAGGPLVALITGLARGIPSGLPIIDLWLVPFYALTFSLVYRYLVIKVRLPVRWVVLIAFLWIWIFCVDEVLFIYSVSLLGIVPFVTGYIGAIPFLIYFAVVQSVITVAAIRAFPGIFGWKEGKVQW
jgi:hypothetical protein